MQGVKTCTREWPSCSLFALEMQLRVWFSDMAWMDITAHACQNGGVSGLQFLGPVLQHPWYIWGCDGRCGTGRYMVLCCWASQGHPGWSTSPWHLYHFVTPCARRSQLIDQPVATVKGVKVLKKKPNQNKQSKKPNSMLGCFSLESLLREQQKEDEWGKLFALFPFCSEEAAKETNRDNLKFEGSGFTHNV